MEHESTRGVKEIYYVKVVFLDIWKKGISNFLPIARSLEAKGVKCLLVHRGSWGSEQGSPNEEMVEGLLCRDIQYYRTNLMYDILHHEKPDAVIVLTTNTIADRSIILAARSLKITSYFLMHGIIFTGEKREIDMPGMARQGRKMRWTRAWKYLRYVLPNYFYSGWKLNWRFAFRAEPYRLIVKSFMDPTRYYWEPPPSSEIHCDWALVWAKEYKDHYNRVFGYPADRIIVVGPPPLDRAFNLLNDKPSPHLANEFLKRYNIDSNRPFTLYLESPGVEQRLEGWNRQSRIDHLAEIASLCAAAGRQLVLKLHPSSECNSLHALQQSGRLCIVRDTDLPFLISQADSVIGFLSTTLDMAIILDKAIITPTWGIAANLPDDFVRHGVAVPAPTPQALSMFLKQPSEVLDSVHDHRVKYIDRFITLTDGKAIQRVVESIEKCRDKYLSTRSLDATS